MKIAGRIIGGRDAFIIDQALKACGLTGEEINALPDLDAKSTVIAKCLYEFVRQEQAMPEDLRMWSDEQDAKAVLLRSMPEMLQRLMEIDREEGIEPPQISSTKRSSPGEH